MALNELIPSSGINSSMVGSGGFEPPKAFAS
jgi:hypothetical protein